MFLLLLTDKGSEFEVNTETGKIRINIFYCDPQTPSQKPLVENNHNYVRVLSLMKKLVMKLMLKYKKGTCTNKINLFGSVGIAHVKV